MTTEKCLLRESDFDVSLSIVSTLISTVSVLQFGNWTPPNSSTEPFSRAPAVYRTPDPVSDVALTAPRLLLTDIALSNEPSSCAPAPSRRAISFVHRLNCQQIIPGAPRRSLSTPDFVSDPVEPDFISGPFEADFVSDYLQPDFVSGPSMTSSAHNRDSLAGRPSQLFFVFLFQGAAQDHRLSLSTSGESDQRLPLSLSGKTNLCLPLSTSGIPFQTSLSLSTSGATTQSLSLSTSGATIQKEIKSAFSIPATPGFSTSVSSPIPSQVCEGESSGQQRSAANHLSLQPLVDCCVVARSSGLWQFTNDKPQISQPLAAFCILSKHLPKQNEKEKQHGGILPLWNSTASASKTFSIFQCIRLQSSIHTIGHTPHTSAIPVFKLGTKCTSNSLCIIRTSPSLQSTVSASEFICKKSHSLSNLSTSASANKNLFSIALQYCDCYTHCAPQLFESIKLLSPSQLRLIVKYPWRSLSPWERECSVVGCATSDLSDLEPWRIFVWSNESIGWNSNESTATVDNPFRGRLSH